MSDAGADSNTREVGSALRSAPAFAEPWQARAFACAVELSRRGLYTWREWVQALGAEIAAHPARPGEDAGATYHRQWLATLEKLTSLTAVASTAEIGARAEQWRTAYLNTPHGQPVKL
ncbi:MAG: nitrile hydratase accessory protein [Steroidobacteraceae bacterium]